jgi:C4-dicarboxylate transporter, DctM subunit
MVSSAAFILITLILIGVPIAFSLGIVGFAIMHLNDLPILMVAQRIALAIDSYVLLGVPFFIFTGLVMNKAGITTRIFNFAYSLVGHMRGSLAHVDVVSNMIFAGVSGAAVADAGGLGPIMLKAMTTRGYDIKFSAAITGAASTIGPIIPPSIPFVIYGAMCGVPVGKQFIAGIIPGILMGLGLMVGIYVHAHFSKAIPDPHIKFSLKLVGTSFFHAILPLMAPIIIVGGILGGIFTPTEAGAVAGTYTIFLGLFVFRELKVQDLLDIVIETMLMSASVIFIIGLASIFGWALTFLQIPPMIAKWILSLTSSPTLVLLLLGVLYLILGCLIDGITIIVMTVPVVFPVILKLGIDPLHFGVLLAVNISIGTLTPPVGVIMFLLSKIANITIEEFTKACFPYMLILFGILFILTLFPSLSTFLPNLIMSQ